jgi:catechol 2,3-dioxygenase-like lactoylglutathione lyase family enzyme
MPMRFSHANLWVHDQDEALAFFTDKLGFELRDDITMAELGDYRWLTVGPPGQPEVAFILSAPGPPLFDAEGAAQFKELIAKGHVGGLHFATDDCRASYEELKGRGVEFSQEPTEQPYGVDAEFRDPSGNRFRLTQRTI